MWGFQPYQQSTPTYQAAARDDDIPDIVELRPQIHACQICKPPIAPPARSRRQRFLADEWATALFHDRFMDFCSSAES